MTIWLVQALNMTKRWAFISFIIWLAFVADITRALIDQVQFHARALFSRNAHGPITDYANYKGKKNTKGIQS